jgi:hypothetical protein
MDGLTGCILGSCEERREGWEEEEEEEGRSCD